MREVDRTPKPCLHKVANHQHGEYVTAKLDGCRCWPCTAATAEYNANRTRAQAYGTWSPFAPAEPAVRHLRALSEAGMGWKRVARAAAVPESSVYPLLYGRPDRNGGRPRTKARKALIDAILAVPMPTIDDLGATVVVDSTGTRRRLEALIALGWSINHLAADHGLDRQALDSALAWVPVQAATARAVRDMFEAIGDTRPPETNRWEKTAAARSRNRAAARGWLPPAEWDPADLDDPYADAPAREATGSTWPGRTAADLDEWLHLVRGGVNPDDAAARCGVGMDAIIAAAGRHDRDDVMRLIRQIRAVA